MTNDENRPLRDRALELMDEVEHSELEQTLEADGREPQRGFAARTAATLIGAMTDADAEAAARRVARLKAEHLEAGPDELVERIIKKKCQQTGAIGAASSSAALIPVLGTLTSLTVGVATDITATFKLQAEMVLEIAAAYDFPLDTVDEQTLILLVTGISTGSNLLLNRAGSQLTVRLGERYARKWLAHALPFVGLVASAGTNVLATYVIGQRAQAYFRHGPDAVVDWKDSLRAVAGVDERKIGGWLVESGSQAWGVVREGTGRAAGAVAEAARVSGDALAAGARTTVGGVARAGALVDQVAKNVGEGASTAAGAVKQAAEDTGKVVGKVVDSAGDLLTKPWRPRPPEKSEDPEEAEEDA